MAVLLVVRYIGMTEVGKDFLTRQDVGGDILAPREVAEAVMKIVNEGESGSVW